jgi:hypothetical protein
MLKHFTFVFHEVNPRLLCVVINETHVVPTFSNGFRLHGSHVLVDHFQRFGTCMRCLSWEWMPNLLPQLSCFANFWHHLFCSKLLLNNSKLLEVFRNTLNMCLPHLLKLLALLMMITKSYHFKTK